MHPVDPACVRFSRVAKTEGLLTLPIKYSQRGFRKKRRGQKIRNLRAWISQPVRTKCARHNDWEIDECPLMGMLRILPTKVCEHLTSLHLYISWQGSRLDECLFQLDIGLCMGIQFKEYVCE